MNDFLRPCNCVHPAEEDCEKCIDEADPKKLSHPVGSKDVKKSEADRPAGSAPKRPVVRPPAGV
jgi:hypothetical protein